MGSSPTVAFASRSSSGRVYKYNCLDNAEVAPMVERRPEEPRVGSSSLPLGTTKDTSATQFCVMSTKSVGSNPILPDQTALVVHRGARRLKKAEGNGSIPVSGSISGSSPIGRGTRKNVS